MKKTILGTLSVLVLLSSCVSQKKYAELEAKQQETQDLLNSASVKLNTCLEAVSYTHLTLPTILLV